MFFLLYGEDTFRSRRKLSAMRERFSATRDAAGLNAAALRAKDATVDQVAEAIYASPFLAEKKLVVLDGFLGSPAADQERIKALLEKKPESTHVIFYEEAGAGEFAKSLLYPLLKAQKYSEEFAPLSGAQLERAAIDECAAAGAQLSPRAARALLVAVGTDAWRLHEELAKLCAYAKATGKAIDEALVAELVAGAQEESLFAFIDACAEGRCGEAGTMLERLLESGAAELQILNMLEKHYRTLIAVADLAERGERDKNAVAKRLGIHPFPAGKALALARRHSPAVLRARYDDLLAIERQIKTSAARPNALLGLFIAKLGAVTSTQ
ncbi:MAG TPA: DNA polymerase III subunit delta [Candidatus Binatia bacterium]|nr:DNA polymerase III subunit delta [Candidatus Binatia bacterium]